MVGGGTESRFRTGIGITPSNATGVGVAVGVGVVAAVKASILFPVVWMYSQLIKGVYRTALKRAALFDKEPVLKVSTLALPC